MNSLKSIKKNGCTYIDSRSVAELIEKQHKHLLRDIRGYCEILEKNTKPNFGLSKFFHESSYFDSTGRELPCYLISKMGCELVANKLTGEKGVLFTAAYVEKFNEMEAAEKTTVLRSPKLGEFNGTARIIVRALENAGVASEQILEFLKSVYEPLGINIPSETIDKSPSKLYTAHDIADIYSVLSHNGNPHSRAIACILNEHIRIGDEHKIISDTEYGGHIGALVQYDDYAVSRVGQWLLKEDYPDEVCSDNRIYHIYYGADKN